MFDYVLISFLCRKDELIPQFLLLGFVGLVFSIFLICQLKEKTLLATRICHKELLAMDLDM